MKIDLRERPKETLANMRHTDPTLLKLTLFEVAAPGGAYCLRLGKQMGNLAWWHQD